MAKSRQGARNNIFVIVGVVIGGLLIARGLIANIAVKQGVKAATGLSVDMGGVDIGLLGTNIGVRNVKVFNPPGFPDKVMVQLPELFVDYDLSALAKGKVHLEMVRVNLAELTVVKNAEGKVNVNSLRPVQEQQAAKEKKAAPAKQPQIQIDELHLKVGRVVYKDYTQGATPVVKEFNVNIDERLQNITSPQAVASAIVMRALARTTVAQLAKIDVNSLRSAAEQGIRGAANEILNNAVPQGAGVLRSFLGDTKQQ